MNEIPNVPYRVFFSWQSDLDPRLNTNFIREGLRSCRRNSQFEIHVDEATRNKVGAINIPATILEKIALSDVFIADVSPVYHNKELGKFSPNPNVVFELGYAVRTLGWSRIILLLNAHYGKPEDLPFDFDRHRVTKYKASEKTLDKSKKDFFPVLRKCIDEIIKAQPELPSTIQFDAESEKNSRDIKNLEWIFSELHLPTLDDFLDGIPYQFPFRTLHFYEGFKGVFTNSLFHIYNDEMRQLLSDFFDQWTSILGFEPHYNLSNNRHLCIFSGDQPSSVDAQEKINEYRLMMRETLNKILALIREEYVQIDLTTTNARAWRDYLEHKVIE